MTWLRRLFIVWVLCLILGLFLSGPGVLSADSTINSCSLAGTYVFSSAVDAPPTDQTLGIMTFHPPANCTDAGTVDVFGTMLQWDVTSALPLSNPGSPYTVDTNQMVTIILSNGENNRIWTAGRLGLIAGNLAHAIVFTASPETNPYIRFSGVATKTDANLLAGPQGPAGSTGPSGPTGPIGLAGSTGPTGPTGATGAMGAHQAPPDQWARLVPPAPHGALAPPVPPAQRA